MDDVDHAVTTTVEVGRRARETEMELWIIGR
jgi:hypothetical protein